MIFLFLIYRECTESSTNSFPLSAVLLLIIALVLLCGLIIVLVKYRGHICFPTPRGNNNSRGKGNFHPLLK